MTDTKPQPLTDEELDNWRRALAARPEDLWSVTKCSIERFVATLDAERATRLAAEARVAEMEKLVYVPGLWRCGKCNFILVQSNLNAANGTVTARDEPGDTCPNCNANLWRVSERQERRGMQVAHEKEWERRLAAEAERDRLREALQKIADMPAHPNTLVGSQQDRFNRARNIARAALAGQEGGNG